MHTSEIPKIRREDIGVVNENISAAVSDSGLKQKYIAERIGVYIICILLCEKYYT